MISIAYHFTSAQNGPNIGKVRDAYCLVITAAAMSDPDALPLAEEEWDSVKPILRVGGRPKANITKVRITIRLSPEVLATFKATGKGWQSRVDAVLMKWIQEHHFQ